MSINTLINVCIHKYKYSCKCMYTQIINNHIIVCIKYKYKCMYTHI